MGECEHLPFKRVASRLLPLSFSATGQRGRSEHRLKGAQRGARHTDKVVRTGICEDRKLGRQALSVHPNIWSSFTILSFTFLKIEKCNSKSKVDLAFTQVRGERLAYNYSPSASIIDPLYMFKYKRPFPDEKRLDLFFFFTHVSKQQNGFSQPRSGHMH